jgi:hypothetical protein
MECEDKRCENHTRWSAVRLKQSRHRPRCALPPSLPMHRFDSRCEINSDFLVSAAGFDLDINAGRQAELVQCFDRFGRSLHNVDHALVSADLVLLPRLLVDVRARKHRVSLNARRQRNRPVNLGIGPLGGINDLRRALVQHRMVVGLHPDANHFVRMPSHSTLPPKVADEGENSRRKQLLSLPGLLGKPSSLELSRNHVNGGVNTLLANFQRQDFPCAITGRQEPFRASKRPDFSAHSDSLQTIARVCARLRKAYGLYRLNCRRL